MIIHCFIRFSSPDNTSGILLSTFTSSKAASTSSKIQNGTGLDFKIANNKLV